MKDKAKKSKISITMDTNIFYKNEQLETFKEQISEMVEHINRCERANTTTTTKPEPTSDVVVVVETPTNQGVN